MVISTMMCAMARAIAKCDRIRCISCVMVSKTVIQETLNLLPEGTSWNYGSSILFGSDTSFSTPILLHLYRQVTIPGCYPISYSAL